jgi:predicted XRE-type DNA-binding protein
MKRTTLGTIGSGNVFADLGLPNPEELLARSKVASAIAEAIERQRKTYDQAGETLGLSGAEVSDICNGRTKDRLNELLRCLSSQPKGTKGNLQQSMQRLDQAETVPEPSSEGRPAAIEAPRSVHPCRGSLQGLRIRPRGRKRADIRRLRCANSRASMSTAIEANRYSPIMPIISAAEIAGRLPSARRGMDGQPIVSLVAASTQSAW